MNVLLFVAHNIFVFTIAMFILFVNNIPVLAAMGVIMAVTIYTNYQNGDCPISLIEDINGGPATVDVYTKVLMPKKFQDPKYRPLITLEMLWIAFMLLAIRIMSLLSLKVLKPTVLELLKYV
jgi:hypothetical protein